MQRTDWYLVDRHSVPDTAGTENDQSDLSCCSGFQEDKRWQGHWVVPSQVGIQS